ncbi:hypothetical protein SLE2022_128090 [Rubroshorea leprosula]
MSLEPRKVNPDDNGLINNFVMHDQNMDHLSESYGKDFLINGSFLIEEQYKRKKEEREDSAMQQNNRT